MWLELSVRRGVPTRTRWPLTPQCQPWPRLLKIFLASLQRAHDIITTITLPDDTSIMSEAGPSSVPAPREVTYCAICTFPPEYCEFGPSASKCRTWLEQNNAQLYARIWSEEAINSNLAAMTTKQAEDLEKEAAKKERKAEAKAEKEKAQKAVCTPNNPPLEHCIEHPADYLPFFAGFQDRFDQGCEDKAQGNYKCRRLAHVLPSSSRSQGCC